MVESAAILELVSLTEAGYVCICHKPQQLWDNELVVKTYVGWNLPRVNIL